MPTIFGEFWYNYQTDGSFTDWLKAKDDDGWELITALCNYSGLVDKHMFVCIFKKKV